MTLTFIIQFDPVVSSFPNPQPMSLICRNWRRNWVEEMADATKWHGPYSLVFLQLLFTFMQLHDCSITRYCLSASVYDYNASNIDDTYGANGNMCHAQKVNADLRTLPTLNDAVFLIKTCHWYCWKYQCPWELSTLPSKHVQGWKCNNFCIFSM